MKPVIMGDTEVFADYFCVGLRDHVTTKTSFIELHEGQRFDREKMGAILSRATTVGFNWNNFDLPLINMAMNGASPADIKAMSDAMIVNNAKYWTLGLDQPNCDRIDLMEVAPLTGGLKVRGGRMHTKYLQDLPYDPSTPTTTPTMRENINRYCGIDLGVTHELYDALQEPLALRVQLGEEYGMDLRSKSDAQIAEAVIKAGVERRGREVPKLDPFRLAGTDFKYDPPPFLTFITPPMQALLEELRGTTFNVLGNGTVGSPKALDKRLVEIAGKRYRMGIGGLHSIEERVSHYEDEHHILSDRDVASNYPKIILNCGLAPEVMGSDFTKVYRTIVEKRLSAKEAAKVAKKAGDDALAAKMTSTADSLKITINGSFGKFGSPYSCLYSPKLMIQTTLTGQLSLLMLIERIELRGIPVISGNTDGIIVRCPRDKLPIFEQTIREWERDTLFETEDTRYKSLHSANVNNYIAIKPDGTAKLKGARFASTSLSKHPQSAIVAKAVTKYLQVGTPVEQTIRACTDVREFITLYNWGQGVLRAGERMLPNHDTKEELLEMSGFVAVKMPRSIQYTYRGGEQMTRGVAYDKAIKLYPFANEEYVGKVVRWYYSNAPEYNLITKDAHSRVASSEGAKLIMELPDDYALPPDLDWHKYILMAYQALDDIAAWSL